MPAQIERLRRIIPGHNAERVLPEPSGEPLEPSPDNSRHAEQHAAAAAYQALEAGPEVDPDADAVSNA